VESSRVSNEVEAIETLKKQNKELSDAIKQLEGNYSTLNQDHTSVANELISAKMDIARIHDENDVLAQTSNELKKKLECMPKQIEERVKEEMDILYTKNKALVERNTTLEEQLAYMENMIIEIKQKYGESENEREVLSQRLVELKKIMA
jgi:chromosome segregation ATPase